MCDVILKNGINLFFVPIDRMEQTESKLLSLCIEGLEIIKQYSVNVNWQTLEDIRKIGRSSRIVCVIIPIVRFNGFESTMDVCSVTFNIVMRAVNSPQYLEQAQTVYVFNFNIFNDDSFIVIKHRQQIKPHIKEDLLILDNEFKFKTIKGGDIFA